MGLNSYTTAAGERNAAFRLSTPVINHIERLRRQADLELSWGRPSVAERLEGLAGSLEEGSE